ncbi:MAG: NAD-dependent epimerase/dehydratase family protein [Anaerolineae bacterium]
MTPPAILITGANGEIGQSLIEQLSARSPETPLLALDLKSPVDAIADKVTLAIQADVAADRTSYERAVADYEVGTIYHLAALLSTAAERDPERAQRVNVDGTFALLSMAARLGGKRGQAVKFVFPSSIAAYGVKDKQELGATPVCEDEHLQPVTMYGINKLYCEQLGLYYATHDQKTQQPPTIRVDFRCVRLPGVISAHTLPTGGTSDYAPEMIHAAAQGKTYASFVRPDTTIPFMVMPDAVNALLQLADAPREHLTRYVYNVNGFSLSAAAFAERVQSYFPAATITFAPDKNRQRIVDSWPANVDDSQALRDWGWRPQYDVQAAFEDYLVPAIVARYASTKKL